MLVTSISKVIVPPASTPKPAATKAPAPALPTFEFTALDATGGFSVQLGLGTSPSGTFDAALFADVDRWLEVVVGIEVLTPRQVIASVPWALVAQQANQVVPDPNGPLKDCGDGTVAAPSPAAPQGRR